MFFVTALVLLFIIKLRFPRGKSISTIIINRYGQQVLQQFRNLEKCSYKLKKTRCDIEFLTICQRNKVIPNFINFKLYNNRLYKSQLYKQFQNELLEKEIRSKKSEERVLSSKVSNLTTNLKESVSFFDFNHLVAFIDNNIKSRIVDVNNRHKHKLSRLGIKEFISDVDPNQFIFNYSNRILSEKEKEVLAHVDTEPPIYLLIFKTHSYKRVLCQ